MATSSTVFASGATTPAAKSGFKMPDIYIVLSVFILVMAVLTYIVPSGQYERLKTTTAHGTRGDRRRRQLRSSVQSKHPVGFMDIVTSIPDGLKRASGIVFLTFMVGAGMGLIKRAGLIDIGVQRLALAVDGKELLIVPILISRYSADQAAFIGVPELSLAYVPILLPLFYRLGC